jgi:predicted esterase
MPYSALVYRDLPPETSPARATIVALHGATGGLDDLVPLARSLGSDVRVVAPEAARGVYTVREMVAHTWYGGGRAYRPEPASFGDSLAQIERFVHDVRERAAEGEPALPWLLGYDQGAVLALALAAIAPDLVCGAMAVCGSLPTFSDPGLLEIVASDVPVLLVGDRSDTAPAEAELGATAERFKDLGGRVTTTWIDDVRQLGPEVATALRTWLDGRLDH